MTQPLRWRKSTFSPSTNCVELADDGDQVAVRNSNHPDAGTLHLPRPVLATWLTGIRAGDLT